MKRKNVLIFVLLINFLLIFTTKNVYAGNEYKEPDFNGYIYNSWGVAVPSANCYVQDKEYTGTDLGVGAFKSPSDIFHKNGYIYIVDTGNNRIVVMDSNFKLVKEMAVFNNNGKEYKLKGPTGIFVDDNNFLYIADKENKRVIKSDYNLNIKMIIEKPNSNLLEEKSEFIPAKITVDKQGHIYIQATNVYQGLMEFDKDGTFIGFYGSNKVEVSAALLADRIWKSILSKEQRQAMIKYVPIEYTNMTIDNTGFLYTTNKSTILTDQIKKLNPKGVNILRQKRVSASTGSLVKNYGDLDFQIVKGQRHDTQFVDVAIDENGFIFALDNERGKIFQYDQESYLISIFGDKGRQTGNFIMPTAIDSYNDNIYVLDGIKNSITIFKTTEFGKTVKNAFLLYNKGLYDEAKSIWEEILNRNSNYEIAYVGIGKALMNTHNFKEAMKYFQYAYDREDYSKAFKEYRVEILSKHFTLFMLAIISIVGFIIWLLVRKGKNENFYTRDMSNHLKNALYGMTHPFKTYEELKMTKNWSVKLSLLILLVIFISKIFVRQFTGFPFNFNKLDELNVVKEFFVLVTPFILWTISNWAVSSLMDGEGTFKEIWVASAYALLPIAIFYIPAAILSRVLTIEEGVFVSFIYLIAKLWSIFLMYCAIMSVQQYSSKKTINTTVLSIVSMIFIVFVGLLVYSIFQQMYITVVTVYKEIIFRF